jgi:glutamate-5-semialdehyde dehydrogenase
MTGMNVREAAASVREAQLRLGSMETDAKNRVLKALSDALAERKEEIFRENCLDLEKARSNELEAPLLKRLKFDEKKLEEVLQGIASLVSLPDPAGKILEARELDQDLILRRVSCPIGVIGMIFESRPDALVQIATLALKSGNGLLLKGGSEASRTNRILWKIIAEASAAAGAPAGWIALLESREDVGELLALDDLVDLLIPRGSNDFVRHIMQKSLIPVLGHADGLTHLYIADDADPEMALAVSLDSKTQYSAVCNALETLLVDSEAAESLLPLLQRAFEASGVELRGCERCCSIINVKTAEEEDWSTEYLAPILSIKVVDGLDAAISHINRYGSGHTDAIITASREKAERFMALVDSADLFWNCSTRFADGYRFGLGAEVGISTNKIHARGPVGLDGLMIYTWQLSGSGNIVADYAEGRRSFTHRDIPLESGT